MVVNDGDESHGTKQKITLNLKQIHDYSKNQTFMDRYIYIYSSVWWDGILWKLSGKCSTPCCHPLLRKSRRETKIKKNAILALVYSSLRTSQISGQNIIFHQRIPWNKGISRNLSYILGFSVVWDRYNSTTRYPFSTQCPARLPQSPPATTTRALWHLR